MKFLKSFSGRPYRDVPIVSFYRDGVDHTGSIPGVVSSHGLQWREHRQFMSSSLSSLGMGKMGVMSDIIEEEVGLFCENLANTLNGMEKVICGVKIYAPTTNNIIWRIATGERFRITDPEITNLTTNLSNMMQALDPSTIRALLLTNSWFVVRLFEYFNMEPIVSMKSVCNYAKRWVEKSSPNADGNLFERYLATFEENEKKGSGFRADGIANRKITNGVIDLLLAGTDTTSTFMEWVVLYLMKYPDVQEKAFQEIKNTIGLDRSPQLSDKRDTPYCQAVIEEIMRMCPEIDIDLPHLTTEDTQAMGYDFPKDTQVILFLGGIHKSEKYFENAKEFNPNRHLVNGIFKPSPFINFFGFGKRRCVGEALGREEVYMFFVSIVQKFEYKMPPNQEFDFKPKLGAVMFPKPYKMLVSCRH